MDLATIKQRQQAAWASGDYAAIGSRFPLIAELLCEAVDLRADERVLDVARGNGNAALAAARRSCQVIGRHLPPTPGSPTAGAVGQPGAPAGAVRPRVIISAPRRSFLWRFPLAEHQVEFFATFYGPTNKALAALGADRATALKTEMLETARRFDVSTDDTLVLRMDYLEAIIHKAATP